MLFAAETLKVLCAATQEFANLKITSTEQVEKTVMRHIKPLMRDVTYPDGTVLKTVFWTLDSGQTDEYRKNQTALRQLLRRFENLPVRQYEPRNWESKAAPLRDAIQSTLRRLVFVTFIEFGDGGLQLRPVQFGLECTLYFAMAGMLEPSADCRVRRCELGHYLDVEADRCGNFVLYAGSRGQPPKFCSPAHAQKHRNLKRREA